MYHVEVINIRDIKKYDGKIFRVDRESPVGNPRHFKSIFEKQEVLNFYEDYFYKTLKEGENISFIEYIDKIEEASKEGKVYLACWCAPGKCHGDTIANYINKKNFNRENKKR